MITKQMEYDVVLATRNRQTVLKVSLPLMLAQTRLPRRFIVVDASDNHREVRDLFEGAFRLADRGVELQILESQPGSSLQRNAGLRCVESPVVVFPDDDALWFPDTAEQVMQIYEKDLDGTVGCVALTASLTYPADTFGADVPPYNMESRDRLAAVFRKPLGWVEEALIPDPMSPGSMWMKVWGKKINPSWLMPDYAELCGPVFGYRMSFRTSVIRGIGGFDEDLGRYAMFEDADATLAVLDRCLNVRATGAFVYHYRVPGARVNGWEFGMMAVLNRTYVVCKHSHPASTVRRMLRRYLYYKIFRYLAQAYSQYGRQRLKGALYGISRLNDLIDAPSDELRSRYLCIRRELQDPAFCA
jgi:glycosyltransferase involved in cell wall biosynthesis